MRWTSFTIALLAFGASAVPATAAETVSNALVGKAIRVPTWKSAGKSLSFDDLKERKGVVVVFLSFDCPVSTSYVPVLNDLAKQYDSKGIAFVGLCPCDDDDAAVAKHAEEYKLGFPLFRDTGLKSADAFQAAYTPEAFLLDGKATLRYRGRIDNGYAARLKRNGQITRNDLHDAIDELLAGKEISQPATQPIGCNIPRPTEAKEGAAKVTYYRDVLPILQNNCQSCHRPNEIGPFSLMTYKQAVNWADDIKAYTKDHRMPPWKPVASAHLRDERRMADKDVATLAAWVDGGTPAGDPKDAPPAKEFPTGWQLGKPDLVLTVDGEMQIGASGRDLFRCFILPTGLTEDKFVTAYEVRPGNTRVVHHTLNFIDTHGHGRKLEQKEKDRPKKDDEQDIGPGYSVNMGTGFAPDGALGGWAPGYVARHLPTGTGYFLPKESDLVVQVHYHRTGRVEKDRIQVGLYFADKPAERRVQPLPIPGRFLIIPANEDNFKVNGTIWANQDCNLLSVMPHMHMLGKEVKVTMTPPDGKPQTLVEIKDWDYNWQETYFFKEPIAIKSGTKFEIEARYDNSDKNPRNPNSPPKWVKFGEQTTDEMCFGFLNVTTDKGTRIRPSFTPPK